MEQLGKGGLQGAKDWQNIQVSDVLNNTQKAMDDVASNFTKLQNRDALDAKDGAMQNVQEIFDKGKDQLSSPEQVERYNNENRSFMMRYITGRIDTHANQQGKAYETTVADDTLKNANTMAATIGGSGKDPSTTEPTAMVAYQKALNSQLDYAKRNGLLGSPETVQAVKDKAASTLVSYAQALAVQNAPAAQKFVEAHQQELGTHYAPLADSLRGIADKQAGEAAFGTTLQQAKAGQGRVSTQGAVAVGDSLADGVRTGAGVQGDTQVGRPSAEVTKSLQALPDGNGKTLVISSGLSNDGANQDPSVVKTQIDIAKAKGYSPVVLGVGDKFAALNPQIQKIATENGARFAPIGPNDGVHPTDGYKTAVANALGGARPAAAPSGAYAPQSSVVQTAVAAGNGFSPEGLSKLIGVESGGNARAISPTGYRGLTQFGSSEWAKYGSGDINDPQQNLIAAQKLAADNRQYLESHLGRKVSDGELYLAHQQGAKGALALLMYPDAPAAAVTSAANIAANGGNPNAPSREFVAKWLKRFDEGQTSGGAAPTATLGSTPGSAIAQTSPAAGEAPIEPAAFTPPSSTPQAPMPTDTPEDLLARQIQLIGADTSLSPGARMVAEEKARQNYTMAQIAAEQDMRAKRAQKDAVLNDLNGSLNQGDPQTAFTKLAQYKSAGKIDDTEYATLSDVIRKRAGDDNPIQMGKGYGGLFDRILAPAGDPNRITDPMDIIKAERDGLVTEKGSNRLQENMQRLRKDNKSFGDQQRVNNLMSTMKSSLSYANETNGLKDPEGAKTYEYKALPALLDQIDDWEKSGKPLREMPLVSDPKQMKAFVDMFRSERDKDKAKTQELNEILGGTRAPPAPDGVKEDYWNKVAMQPPPLRKSDGSYLTGADAIKWWSGKVESLARDPSPEAIKDWDDLFGKLGYDAPTLLNGLGVKYALPPNYRNPSEPTGGNALPPYFMPPG